MNAVRPVIVSNGVTYLQMTLVGSHSKWEREKEGKEWGRNSYPINLHEFQNRCMGNETNLWLAVRRADYYASDAV